jgi:hypothetical protein
MKEIKSVEFAAPENWTLADNASKAMSSIIQTMELIPFHENKRTATLEICDDKGVAYYVIDVKRVREFKKN